MVWALERAREPPEALRYWSTSFWASWARVLPVKARKRNARAAGRTNIGNRRLRGLVNLINVERSWEAKCYGQPAGNMPYFRGSRGGNGDYSGFEDEQFLKGGKMAGAQRNDPLPSFRFLVEIEGIQQASFMEC